MNPDLDLKHPSDCYARVLGVDHKWHIALLWENKTCCGIDILEKNEDNVPKSKSYFSCYECTY